MAPKSTGAATDQTPPATAPAEPVAPPSEPADQKPDVNAQLQELQGQLSKLVETQTKLEKEKNEAVAYALRHEAMYKGLQNQTTKTLQQASEDRKTLEQLRQDRAEISELKEMLSTVASRVLSEDENKELQFKQRELQLKLKEQAIAAATQSAAAPQSVASPQYTTPEDEKAQFLNYYFGADIGIESTNPNIDWGDGAASTQEAFRRFTTSVLKIKNEMDSARSQNAMDAITKQTNDALAAFKAEQATLLTHTQEEIAKAKEDAINTARKDSEKKLRALGADVPGTQPPDAGGNKTLMATMNEELSDDLLRTPKGREEYNRRLEVIKAKMRGR